LVHARTPSLIERIEAALGSEEALAPSEREGYLDAFRQELAGYAGDILRGQRAEGAEVLLRVVSEGLFDGAPRGRTVAIASAAYIAVSRGSEPEVVEGIALYGFRKKIGIAEIEAWAVGYRDMVRSGVPAYLAEDLVFNAAEHGWDTFTFNSFKWVLADAARAGYAMEEFHSYVMANYLKGRRKPGALGSEAMRLFREADRKGVKPEVPEYEGSFIPRAGEIKPEEAPTLKKEEKAAPEREKKYKEPEKKQGGLLGRLEKAWKSFLGAPYVWGGQTRKGTDCSGLVHVVFGDTGIRLPRVTRELWKAGGEVRQGALRKGDLVFFRTIGSRISHVGIVTDAKKGRFVHASSSRGVVYDRLSAKYYKSRYAGARRVIPSEMLALLGL
jgi:hypothetical protein